MRGVVIAIGGLIIILAAWPAYSAMIPVTTQVIKQYVIRDGKVVNQPAPVPVSQSKQTAAQPVQSIKSVTSVSRESAVPSQPKTPQKKQQLQKNSSELVQPLGGEFPVLSPLPVLTPLTNGANSLISRSSVSPIGQWLGDKLSWLDSLFSISPVKPWQKATLAEPVMLPGGVMPVVDKFANKIFISKEASLGGDGVAGGGCGCK